MIFIVRQFLEIMSDEASRVYVSMEKDISIDSVVTAFRTTGKGNQESDELYDLHDDIPILASVERMIHAAEGRYGTLRRTPQGFFYDDDKLKVEYGANLATKDAAMTCIAIGAKTSILARGLAIADEQASKLGSNIIIINEAHQQIGPIEVIGDYQDELDFRFIAYNIMFEASPLKPPEEQ